MSNLLFEICAPNIQSALAAQEAGAQRIELCSSLDQGGVTPSYGLIKAAVRHLQIPVNVLIRPREGDFCYSETELEVMMADIAFCRDNGVHGVVIGALTPERQLDLPKLQAMKAVAGEMELVHHRAFDFSASPEEALEQLIDAGFCRVLSSGQSDTALEGLPVLRQLITQAGNRISVMPGAGINQHNIRQMVQESGAYEYHFTGKVRVNPPGNNAIKGLDASYWQSDVDGIRQVIDAAGKLKSGI